MAASSPAQRQRIDISTVGPRRAGRSTLARSPVKQRHNRAMRGAAVMDEVLAGGLVLEISEIVTIAEVAKRTRVSLLDLGGPA